MENYRKKPVVIQAEQYDGTVESFLKISSNDKFKEMLLYYEEGGFGKFYIKTLEGQMHVSPGDYVIKGVKNEFYPCKPDIFEATYEKVNNN